MTDQKPHRISIPKYSLSEELLNAISHGLGALFGIVGTVLCIVKAANTGDPWRIVSGSIFGVTVLLLYLMSCLYHSYKSGLAVKRIWRRFDYSSIYLLIGGTFAPMYLVYWENVLGIVLFCVQWALIIAGITIICVFGPGRFRPIHYTLYFVIGWSAIMFIPDWFRNDKPLLGWIVGGGIVYTLGMIPFVKDTKGMHFIWHIFVMLGAALHWFGMYLYVY